MRKVVFLDAGPLGLVTNPKHSEEATACNRWLASLLEKGNEICIPEITDYEVRRELIRAKKDEGIRRLDGLKALISYIPISTEAMLKAAEFWAQARQDGRQTADDKALDADIILMAQAATTRGNDNNVVIATTNVSHLSLFARAAKWDEIHP